MEGGAEAKDPGAAWEAFESPSAEDGVPRDLEEMQLVYGTDLIQECGLALRLPQFVVATAQMLFQRFYLVVSLQSHSHVWAAAAALLVASKSEEHQRKIRDVANVVHDRMCVREGLATGTVRVGDETVRRPLDFYGAAGYDWKTTIMTTERHLLKELGFQIRVDHPHKFVLVFMNTLREKSGAADWAEPESRTWLNVLQSAWNYANDSLRLRLAVLEPAEAIAVTCIALASADSKLSLPTGWQVVLGSSERASRRIGAHIRRLYTLPRTRGRFVDVARSGVLDVCGKRREPRRDDKKLRR